MIADPLCYPRAALQQEFLRRFGKGEYYAAPFFRSLYKNGSAGTGHLPMFRSIPELAARVQSDFVLRLPEIKTVIRDEASIKLLLQYPDGVRIETVVLQMSRYTSLCLSTQAGCARGCRFCETGRLGFERNLTTGEIVAQIMVVKFYLGIKVDNVVFMGMGEPFDNFDNLVSAIEIMKDQRGLDVPVSSMTVSTAGHVPGIRRLARIINDYPERGFNRLRLAVSLHSTDNRQRSELMPINRSWPLEELHSAMKDFPLARERDRIFIEYALIPGVNDHPEAVRGIIEYLRDIRACVNIIPCNPVSVDDFRRPSRLQVEGFFHALTAGGQYCRIRDTRGDSIMAACGQLGALSCPEGRNTCKASGAVFPRTPSFDM